MSTKRKALSSGDIFKHKRHTFKLTIERDECMGEPWKEHDGHGVISKWVSRGKAAGERVLNADRGSYRYYDVAETIKLATKDGWGIGEDSEKALAAKLGRKPTKREIAAQAVEQDFEHMKDWCEDRWEWVYVAVVLLKEDADAENGYFETKHRDSLGGIESDSGEYLTNVAYELAEGLLVEVRIKESK